MLFSLATLRRRAFADTDCHSPCFVCSDYPGLFGDEGRKRLTQIKATIMRASMDETYEIQQMAVITLIQFIIENSADEDDKRVVKTFQDCMQHIYRVTTESLKHSDPDVLKHLIELVEESPKLFRQDVAAVFDFATMVSAKELQNDAKNMIGSLFSLQAITNSELQEDLRQLCMELLVTLCESAPQIVRKHAESKIPQFGKSLLSVKFAKRVSGCWSKI